jgi:glycosyltransferase involved in cell wall biosynthesis
MKLISIVIPCYNSEATIRKVVEMVMEEFKKMDGYDCEFVLVNDGSPKDNTYGEIKKLGEQYQNVKGINLLRNFGQHNALMAALHYTEGDFILGMDDDMQTHPSQISKLIHKMEEGYDLVYGCYPKRKNSFLKTFASGTVIAIVYFLLAVFMSKMFLENGNYYSENVFTGMSEDTAMSIMIVVGIFFTLMNWTLAYFRFKESEIVNRM